MKAQIRLGKIFGIEIGLHDSRLIIAALIALSPADYFKTAHPNWGGGVIGSMTLATAWRFL